jgi:hypothetical protein
MEPNAASLSLSAVWSDAPSIPDQCGKPVQQMARTLVKGQRNSEPLPREPLPAARRNAPVIHKAHLLTGLRIR